jgi:hypothetical protein
MAHLGNCKTQLTSYQKAGEVSNLVAVAEKDRILTEQPETSMASQHTKKASQGLYDDNPDKMTLSAQRGK